jgi:hypothetical protein
VHAKNLTLKFNRILGQIFFWKWNFQFKRVLGAELHAKIIILCLIIEQLNTIPGSIGPEKSIPTNKIFLIGLWSHFLEFKPKSKAYYINMIKNVIWLAKLNSSSKSDLEKYVSKV